MSFFLEITKLGILWPSKVNLPRMSCCCEPRCVSGLDAGETTLPILRSKNLLALQISGIACQLACVNETPFSPAWLYLRLATFVAVANIHLPHAEGVKTYIRLLEYPVSPRRRRRRLRKKRMTCSCILQKRY